jgi:hypothetical protein
MTLDGEDAQATIETGVTGRVLSVHGWFASHADSGTPGPHVRLRTNDGQDPVLRTSQLPDLIDALSRVAGRIEELWDEHGEVYTTTVTSLAPDPYDPMVIREREMSRLDFHARVAARLPEVVARLLEADSTDEALDSVAALLGVDPVDVMVGLARFDLLSVTRPALARGAERLEALRHDKGL